MILGTLRRAVRRVRSAFEPRGLVLLYHRIVSQRGDDIHRLCVTRRNFGEQLEVIRRSFKPGTLRDVASLRDGKGGDIQVAITFDDGYVDNLRHALPVLKQYGVPATVFLATRAVAAASRFWWDELNDAVLGIDSLRNSAFRKNHSGAEQDVGLKEVHGALHRWLASISEGERISILMRFRNGFASDRREIEAVRAMGIEELRELAADQLIEIGGHTVTHGRLTSLDAEGLWQEISGCKTQIQEWVGCNVSSFSYPFGWRDTDYNDEAVRVVRKAGFECACAASPGLVRRSSDLYQLPRMWVCDWNGDEFDRHLQQWLAGY